MKMQLVKLCYVIVNAKGGCAVFESCELDKLRASEKYHSARAFLFNISQILIVPPPPI